VTLSSLLDPFSIQFDATGCESVSPLTTFSPLASPPFCSEPEGSSTIVSTGDGPERAVLQQVIQMLIEDPTLWTSATDGSGWVRPVFTPVLSLTHQIRWKTMGTFLLLHLLTLGNGPEPVSPFLLYLLLTSALPNKNPTHHAHMQLSLRSLYQLDAGTAKLLQPWMMLKETDRLSGFAGGLMPPLLMPIQNLLAQSGEYQVSNSPQPSLLSPC
jgi:hypothetical protein